MNKKGWLFNVLVLISAATAVSGAVQLAAPGFVLAQVGGQAGVAGSHFFAIVGMFMLLFGALMLHALLSSSDHPIPVLWSGVQKLGAAGAVAWGVSKGAFGGIALLVAAFDLLSGVLILTYWKQIKERTR